MLWLPLVFILVDNPVVELGPADRYRDQMAVVLVHCECVCVCACINTHVLGAINKLDKLRFSQSFILISSSDLFVINLQPSLTFPHPRLSTVTAIASQMLRSRIEEIRCPMD